jgi:DNA-binding phage protein
MPVVSVGRSHAIPFSPTEELKKKEIIVSAILECLEKNQPDGIIEILNAYLDAINKTEFAEKAEISRRTLYDMLKGSKNPTLRVLTRCIHEILFNFPEGFPFKK